MDLLVIGGSRFLGKHFVQAALERGHRLTLFNRGTRPPPPGVELIRGDRNESLDELRQGAWDAVIDTCAYHPRQVRAATRALEGRAGSYLLVSTISVYADPTVPHQDEGGALIELQPPYPDEVTNETYGGLKVLCERALEEDWTAGRLVVRPGLIVGPDDPTDRFTYWPVRVARGGEVLGPSGPDMPVQWIDVRDLAEWLAHALEQGVQGVHNAVCEADRFTIGDLLDAARAESGGDARVTWIEDDFLLEREVVPFQELPLWIPGSAVNLSRIDASRARAAGLVARPVAETVRDTLAWYRSGGDRPLTAGLDAEREQELLRAWHAERPHSSASRTITGPES